MVMWLFAHGVMPLYTPLSGSWLNMAEAVQRILCTRALNGQHPKSAAEIITWLEDTAAGWNAAPTPFVWDGKRRERRLRARQHRPGGSAAILADQAVPGSDLVHPAAWWLHLDYLTAIRVPADFIWAGLGIRISSTPSFMLAWMSSGFASNPRGTRR